MTPRKTLFIVMDQFRADCLHGALAAHVPLPNLRAFAEEAVSFRRHYSVTNPCGPSRASLLTGRYAMNHRSVRNGTPLAEDTPNLARAVRAVGVEPFLFGYTDTSRDPRAHPPRDPALSTYEQVMPGFIEKTEMRAEESYPWRGYLWAKGYDLPPYDRFYVPVAQQPGAAPAITDPAFYSAEDSDTAFLTNEALKEIAVRPHQGWFAHVTYIRPHPPFVAPAPYNAMIDPGALPLPRRRGDMAAEAAAHPFFAALLSKLRMTKFVDGFEDAQLRPDDDAVIQAMRAVYLGLAAEVDAQIGRLLDHLRQTGEIEQTLIVITADHAEMLGDNYQWGKDSVYDAAYHTPLLIRWPGGARGRVVEAFTESVDVMPTILEWLGADVPPGVDGRSLRPWLQGETPADWRDCSFSELDLADPYEPTIWQQRFGLGEDEGAVSILREGRFKLVHFAAATLPPMLFDMTAPGGEHTDLAADPAHAATLLRMTQKLLTHRMRRTNRMLTGVKIADGGAQGWRR